MSLISAMNTALTGLRAAQLQIQATSNNIANASTPGYTKKSITTVSQGNVPGVTVTGYTRSTDQALQSALLLSTSDLGRTSTQNDYYSLIKDAYGISSNSVGLQTAMDNFITSWQSLSATPESSIYQLQTVNAAKDLATQINQTSQKIEQIDQQAKADTSDQVSQLNSLLAQVADLNSKVSGAQDLGEDATNYEDQRDQAIQQISSLVKVTVTQQSNGRVGLMTQNGLSLLDVNPTVFSYNGTTITTASGLDVTGTLTGGSIQALIDIRADNSPATASTDPGKEVIRKMRDQLNELTDMLTGTGGTPATFADAYDGGTTQAGELANSFFVGADRFSLAVNPALLNGTATIKQSSVNDVVSALTDKGHSFTAGTLTTNSDYSGFISTMVSNISQSAGAVNDNFTSAQTSQQTYSERLSSETGVNVDEEVLALSQIQNSYAANARIISVVQQMFDTLNQAVG